MCRQEKKTTEEPRANFIYKSIVGQAKALVLFYLINAAHIKQQSHT